MQFTTEMLKPVTASGAKAASNVKSIVVALNEFGATLGMDQPHRFAQYGAQLSHESMGFVHDVEVWGRNGGTAAQKRYEDRADLGHSSKVPGEAHKFRGRTPLQLTGRANYISFRDWCRAKFPGHDVPDFEANPDAVLTDPWEGLAPIWYWDTKNLNKFADTGNIEMITKRINGGLNGYGDRLEKYSKLGLAILGYQYTPTDIKQFQTVAKSSGFYDGELDGDDGPKTRAAIHQSLVRLGTVPVSETKAAPVTETVAVEVPVPVAPKGADKPNMGRIWGGLSVVGTAIVGFVPTDPYIRLGIIGLVIVGVIILVIKAELIASRVKAAYAAFGGLFGGSDA